MAQQPRQEWYVIVLGKENLFPELESYFVPQFTRDIEGIIMTKPTLVTIEEVDDGIYSDGKAGCVKLPDENDAFTLYWHYHNRGGFVHIYNYDNRYLKKTHRNCNCAAIFKTTGHRDEHGVTRDGVVTVGRREVAARLAAKRAAERRQAGRAERASLPQQQAAYTQSQSYAYSGNFPQNPGYGASPQYSLSQQYTGTQGAAVNSPYQTSSPYWNAVYLSSVPKELTARNLHRWMTEQRNDLGIAVNDIRIVPEAGRQAGNNGTAVIYCPTGNVAQVLTHIRTLAPPLGGKKVVAEGYAAPPMRQRTPVIVQSSQTSDKG